MSWNFIKTNRTPTSVEAITDHILYRLDSVMDRSGTEKNFHDTIENVERATKEALSIFLAQQQGRLEAWKEQQAKLEHVANKEAPRKPDREPDGYTWPEFRELRPPQDEAPTIRESSSERRARQRRERVRAAETANSNSQYSTPLVDTEGTNRITVPQGRLVVPNATALNSFNDLLNFDPTATRVATTEYEYHISSRGWSSCFLVEHDFTNRLLVEVPIGLTASELRRLHTDAQLTRFKEALLRALQVRTMQSSLHVEAMRETLSSINSILTQPMAF